MERIDKIVEDQVFLMHLAAIETAEAARFFCKHGMVHFLDVARIAWILNLEDGLGLQKDVVYAAALLHDIGKQVQYTNGTSHEIAGSEIAPPILKACGYNEDEIEEIRLAILSHRDPNVAEEKSLRGILYRADKVSRACYACNMSHECHWTEDKKIKKIVY